MQTAKAITFITYANSQSSGQPVQSGQSPRCSHTQYMELEEASDKQQHL